MFRSLLGFDIDFWDYVTFVTIMILVVAGVVIYCWLAGLPGRIAIARKHPEAEAVKLLGWAGLLPTIYPWVQAFIWAFKPTDIIDIRRFPREEQGHRRRNRPAKRQDRAAAGQEQASKVEEAVVCS